MHAVLLIKEPAGAQAQRQDMLLPLVVRSPKQWLLKKAALRQDAILLGSHPAYLRRLVFRFAELCEREAEVETPIRLPMLAGAAVLRCNTSGRSAGATALASPPRSSTKRVCSSSYSESVNCHTLPTRA